MTPDDRARLADDLRLALRQLTRQMRQMGEQDGSGLPLQQKKVLYAISLNPGIGVAELARQEDVRGPTMSAQVKALEAAGLVARSAPDPNDRRRIGLVLSAQGERLMSRLLDTHRDWLVGKIAELPDEGAEALRQAVVYLKQLSR